MHLRRLITAAVAAATVLTLASCGSDDGADGGDGTPAAEVHGGHQPEDGTVLDTPFDKPDLTLTDTTGEPYDLRAETDGHATLLYFGYTNCPDICPLTMSNIAVATAGLTEEQRADLRVVFVTTDPERDTPASLGAWLDAQDPDFTGLTGDFTAIQEAAESVGIYIEPSVEEEDGSIVSTHGTQVVAFLPTDDRGHVLYSEGVTAQTFARDLPKLLEGELP